MSLEDDSACKECLNIVAVSDNGTHLETHSVRFACIKDSERYYIVFALSA